jgi:hypothetical protein
MTLTRKEYDAARELEISLAFTEAGIIALHDSAMPLACEKQEDFARWITQHIIRPKWFRH